MSQDDLENSVWRVYAASEDETSTLAHEVVALLRRGDMVTLSGDLGAGKTTFARAMIRHLLDDPQIEAPSPTFTLMQVYEKGNLRLVHADFYRLNGAGEAAQIKSYFSAGASLLGGFGSAFSRYGADPGDSRYRHPHGLGYPV